MINNMTTTDKRGANTANNVIKIFEFRVSFKKKALGFVVRNDLLEGLFSIVGMNTATNS